MRLLFVCLGNICRSPTAEAAMRHLLAEEGLTEAVEIDSAGTGEWHIGNPPDKRSAATAAARGITLEGRARQVEPYLDFEHYDLILAMDRSNHTDLLRLAPDASAREKVRLLREFDPTAVASDDLEVPDPYYGGPDGFEDVLDLVLRACDGLLATEIRPRLA